MSGNLAVGLGTPTARHSLVLPPKTAAKQARRLQQKYQTLGTKVAKFAEKIDQDPKELTSTLHNEHFVEAARDAAEKAKEKAPQQKQSLEETLAAANAVCLGVATLLGFFTKMFHPDSPGSIMPEHSNGLLALGEQWIGLFHPNSAVASGGSSGMGGSMPALGMSMPSGGYPGMGSPFGGIGMYPQGYGPQLNPLGYGPQPYGYQGGMGYNPYTQGGMQQPIQAY